ncbi:hypothetical protein IE81DRAFT_138475 [Ceraceosorus guamensis]|uniref:Uncharacterized protein n=1 Tax=Ceraceosorus guamensis TaxID=1522189 RepID=A0A316VXH7_9BASI|nr:hypothetical protein IE81DRAFT_138475 [Ceraceosorus guamensis]PWN42326.1 hypothetical protein IE81DRAFT_138475 [Ceraceosorus guamensis]
MGASSVQARRSHPLVTIAAVICAPRNFGCRCLLGASHHATGRRQAFLPRVWESRVKASQSHLMSHESSIAILPALCGARHTHLVFRKVLFRNKLLRIGTAELLLTPHSFALHNHRA